jgi:hypothetical protein
VPRSRMVELYLHLPICLHGLMFSSLSTWTYLPFLIFIVGRTMPNIKYDRVTIQVLKIIVIIIIIIIIIIIMLYVYPLLSNVLLNKFREDKFLMNTPLLGYATIDEVVFSLRSAPSNNRITGLCNPFPSNGWVNTFPRIGPCYESGDVIKNRDGVFRGVCAECL